jgi:hypothetical protein
VNTNLRVPTYQLKPPIPSEHQEQSVVILWWDRIALQRWPLTIYHLFAIPNAGAGASRGQAGKMKAEGARSGIPDLFLAVPRGEWAGMFIEMKRRDGKPSFAQEVAMMALGKRYKCVVCRGADEAIKAITEYLAL